MAQLQIVIDTSTFVSALRSRRGASYKLLSLIDSGKFEINISVPLILEYEAAAKRLVGEILLTESEIDAILDYVCVVSRRHKISYLWRPFLRDPQDDMVLELAAAANCDFIVTYNKDDFRGAERFGLEIVTAIEFLEKIGELP